MMRKIVYYVASSLDGFIAGVEDDISGFVPEGPGVEQYLQDLQGFDTVIMGRKTYEFGYKFGLTPGQPAYPHMKHYIFSNTLTFESQSQQIEVCSPDIEYIKAIRNQEGADIYLCGGGEFAGWLLDHKQIDILKIKLNPLVLGKGVKLFGNSDKSYKLVLLESEKYEDNLHIITYQVIY